MENLYPCRRQSGGGYAGAIPIAPPNFIAHRVTALPNRKLMSNGSGRGVYAALSALPHLWIVGTLRVREVALAIIQKNGHEPRIHLGSDDEIGDFVPVDVLRRDLESTGGSNQVDRGPWAGAEFELQRIFGLRRALVRDSNHRQVGLQIAIEIGNRKMRGTLRERAANEEGCGTIQAAMRKGQQHQQQAGAKDGKREGREPEKGAHWPEHAATVYRMGPGFWQS
jgi:hypothetical protein